MLPDQHGQTDLSDSQGAGRRKSQPEFVGAPTEYADEEEVPAVVSAAAKVVAGGVLTWSVVMTVLLVGGGLCLACIFLAFLFGGLR